MYYIHETTAKNANSVSEVAEYDESNTHDTQQSELEQIWITAKKKTALPDDVNLEDYLSADDNVSTCYELTEVDIIQSIKDSKDEAIDESSEDEEAVMGDVCNVTSSEALSSLEVMRTFISSQNKMMKRMISRWLLMPNGSGTEWKGGGNKVVTAAEPDFSLARARDHTVRSR
ncbi:Hypothetical protein CINCED_3A008573 [Cinara cedri]|uniref:Uncharacterized protein n=1 Tax=Cinara cedri TaxID=506608 RepID=A0A5E4NC15_9HEMI|nr:Hypothetical protein CINCED_3A008573 [Cinara cedri]